MKTALIFLSLAGLGYAQTGVDVTGVSRVNRAMYCPDTSVSANTITCTTFATLSNVYAAGQMVNVLLANGVTGATTININTLGAKSVTKNGSTALASGDLSAGGVYSMTYDGTRFVVGGVLTTAGTAVPSTTNILQGNGSGGYGTGYTISGNSTVVGTTTGTLTSGHAVSIDASGNLIDASINASNIVTATGTLTSNTVILGNGSKLTKTSSITDNGTTVATTEPFSAAAYNTATKCANGATPAVCVAAPAGAVAVPAGVNSTLVVQTTAVTASSIIVLQPDDSLTIGATTCNTTAATLALSPAITARTANTSFTITLTGTTTTNPVCVSYWIVN